MAGNSIPLPSHQPRHSSPSGSHYLPSQVELRPSGHHNNNSTTRHKTLQSDPTETTPTQGETHPALPSLASCSEWGSSMINKSAPRPASAPPTPMAKYSPLKFVPQREADFDYPLEVPHLWKHVLVRVTEPTRLRTRRPKLTARSAVCDAMITFLMPGAYPKTTRAPGTK
jgi:hypothetical protein